MIQETMFSGYEKYLISSGELTVGVMTLGATITEMLYDGKNRVLAFEKAEDYLNNSAYLGATVGRYANRIGDSRFTLDGVEYALTPNEGKNQLHGGPGTWAFREWKAEILGEDSVRFSITGEDGENGFPGTIAASATFTVKGSALRIDYRAETDRPTVFAPTNHAYFNLAGEGTILDTVLQMNAPLYLQTDSGLIPTGLALPCTGEYSFASPHPIARNFDHCFVVDSTEMLRAEAGGIAVTLRSDMPAVQLYTGSGLGAPFVPNAGFAIEPEFYPDSPNHPEWPSPVIRPGESFHRYEELEFSRT